MDSRLKKIISYVKNGIGVIDVGTDHGYIPIRLALDGYRGKIFASDINADPLKTAIENAKSHGVDSKITFLLSDGLDKCSPDDVDTVIIAGMGGDLICSILDEGYWTWSSRYSLILQPMTKVEVVRYFLVNNGFNILNDDLVSAGDRDYSVLNVRYYGNNEKYSDAEIYTGKHPSKKLIDKTVSMLEKKPSCDMYDNILKELKEKY